MCSWNLRKIAAIEFSLIAYLLESDTAIRSLNIEYFTNSREIRVCFLNISPKFIGFQIMPNQLMSVFYVSKVNVRLV